MKKAVSRIASPRPERRDHRGARPVRAQGELDHAPGTASTEANRTILLAAAVVNLLSLALKGVRWWIFLRPVGVPSFWMALKATFAGAGLNNILVANGGEAARVVFVARAAHVPSAKVLATLALERMFELIGYIVMLALVRVVPRAAARAVAHAPRRVGRARRRDRADDLSRAASRARRGHRRRRAVVGVARRASGRTSGTSVHTIGGISTGPRFAVALALSVGIWALQVWTYSLTARSADFNIPLVGTVAAILAVNLGFAVRATPGNVGVFQAHVRADRRSAFGMDRDQAIAVAFLIQTQQIIPVTLLGVALAPEFIFKRKKVVRAGDEGLNLPSRPEAAADAVVGPTARPNSR